MSSSRERVEAAQAPQLMQAHRRQALRLDVAHIPAAALHAQHIDVFAELIFRGGLDRGVAAAMQHQLRIGTEQPRRIGAQRQIFRSRACAGIAASQNLVPLEIRKPRLHDFCFPIFVNKFCPGPRHPGQGRRQVAGKRLRRPCSVAAQVPRSVMKPVTRRAGVTRPKPGLSGRRAPAPRSSTVASVPDEVRPVIFEISSGDRSIDRNVAPVRERPVDRR